MELTEFFKALGRHKLLLILVPLFTLIAAGILVQILPDKYEAHARLATGITDRSQQMLSGNSFDQESKVNQEFNNLIQMMQLKKMLDQVSYKLILHDLQSALPFRKPTSQLAAMDDAARKRAIAIFTRKQQAMESLSLFNIEEKALYELLQSMKYDDESLRKQLNVYQLNNSDFIDLNYSSSSPLIAAFVLNTLTTEFVSYYTNFSTENKRHSVSFLDSALQVKRQLLARDMDALKNYKIEHHVLNTEEQAKTIYGQIADLSTRKSLAEKDQVAYSAALGNVNSHLKPVNRSYLESDIADVNQDIVQTKDQIKEANDLYVQSNFSPSYKSRLDTLQRKLNAQIYRQSDRVAYSPVTTKEALVNQKLSLEVAHDLAQHSVGSFNSEIGSLNARLQQLVPDEAVIHSLENNVAIADKEFTQLLQRYNQASMEAGYTLPLRIVEKAMPGSPLPGKKLLLVGFSGISSLILCVLVIFGFFYFDRSVDTPLQLAASTKLPVLGSLNLLPIDHPELQHIWSEQYSDSVSILFKNLLRSIRFELETELGNNEKVIAVTSFTDGAGKTFFTLGLAYAFARVNKRVLVIDGNFLNPDISRMIKDSRSLEKFFLSDGHLRDDEEQHRAATKLPISILGNHAGDNSLLELVDEHALSAKLEELRETFDVILIETCSLEKLSKAKEWILFADKVISVFESGNAIENASQPDIQYLKNLNGKFAGLVINKIPDTGESSDAASRKSYRELRPWGNRLLDHVFSQPKRIKAQN